MIWSSIAQSNRRHPCKINIILIKKNFIKYQSIKFKSKEYIIFVSDTMTRCPICRGKGYVLVEEDAGGISRVTCPTCRGNGSGIGQVIETPPGYETETGDNPYGTQPGQHETSVQYGNVGQAHQDCLQKFYSLKRKEGFNCIECPSWLYKALIKQFGLMPMIVGIAPLTESSRSIYEAFIKWYKKVGGNNCLPSLIFAGYNPSAGHIEEILKMHPDGLLARLGGGPILNILDTSNCSIWQHDQWGSVMSSKLR